MDKDIIIKELVAACQEVLDGPYLDACTDE